MVKSFLNILMGSVLLRILIYGEAVAKTTNVEVKKPSKTGLKEGGGNSELNIPCRVETIKLCNVYPQARPIKVAKIIMSTNCMT